MRRLAWIAALVSALGPFSPAFSSPQPPQSGEKVQIADNRVGRYGHFRPASGAAGGAQR